MLVVRAPTCTPSVRNGSWLTSTGTRGRPIAPDTARSARSRSSPASSRAVTCRFTVAMDSAVSVAMVSRATGPRSRAAAEDGAAAPSAMRSDGATMWCRARSGAGWTWRGEAGVTRASGGGRRVRMVRTLVSLNRVGGGRATAALSDVKSGPSGAAKRATTTHAGMRGGMDTRDTW